MFTPTAVKANRGTGGLGGAARPTQPSCFDLQGHRGCRFLFPENSLPGFAAAIALGVSSIELDVVLTADGVPVVLHDLTLNPDIVRGADGGWIAPPGPSVASLRAAQLAEFDIGRIRPTSRYAARCRGQVAIDGTRIPTLAQACEQVRGSFVRLDIELKTHPSLADGPAGPHDIVEAALAVVEATQSVPFVSWRSFDQRVLRRLRQLRPEAPLAWLTAGGRDATGAAVSAEIHRDGWPDWPPTWAPDHRMLGRAQIDEAHAAGLLVKPWTVNAPSRMRQLIRWGVDGICTDRPDLAGQLSVAGRIVGGVGV